jgi:F0F1-type ATP synthase delta subunit
MATTHSAAPRRYAEALFECVRQASYEQFATDLELAVELTKSAEIEQFLDNPSLPAAERQAVIDDALGDRVAAPGGRRGGLRVRRGTVDQRGRICAE